VTLYQETWFYAPVQAADSVLTLPDDEEKHARKVLRLQPDSEILITNGMGSVFRGRLLGGDGAQVEILERVLHEPSPPAYSVALALLKGNDLEIPLEGVCEFPVRDVFLLRTDQSSEFRGQNFEKLLERLRRKSLAALKQAKKSWLTRIHPPQELQAWREKNRIIALAVAHPGKDNLPDPQPGELHVLVGPEGGFSKSELAYLFEQENCYCLPLGPTRLRAIHAPVAALGSLIGRR